MKILAQVNAAPMAMLWDDPKVVMLLEFGVVYPNVPNQAPEIIEFVADAESLTRLGNDLVRMAEDLTKRAKERGFLTETPELEVPVEEVTE